MSDHATRHLAPEVPDLDWTAHGGPRSRDYEDIYFSSADGLAETETVFIHGCRLKEQLARLGPNQHLIIGELGFGSGLNVLAMLDLWRRAGPAGAWLHLVSIEAAPMSADQMRRAHQLFPQLGDLSELLISRLPAPIKGVHRRRFQDERVSLTLAYLPAIDALDSLEFQADAWFLDGFAPSRNPDMWSPEILEAIGAHTKPGGRAATFTVAGAVRRGLEAVGFAVEKCPGFGAKRERLEAIFHGSPSSRRSILFPAINQGNARSAMIIGAGIAGACTARALADRGFSVKVLETHEPAAGASGNRAGLLAPRLDLDDRPISRFHRCAFSYVLDLLDDGGVLPIGVAMLALNDSDGDRFAKLAKSGALPPDQLQELQSYQAIAAGADGLSRGLWLPQAGLVRPLSMVAGLLAGIQVSIGARVATLRKTAHGWCAHDENGHPIAEAEVCVICAGGHAAEWSQTAHMPIQPMRGQLSYAALADQGPDHALMFGGYAAPDGLGLLFGATYDAWTKDGPPSADEESDRRNFELLQQYAPKLAAKIDPEAVSGRASLRATTPDRLPLVGAVVKAEAYTERFVGLKTGLKHLGDAPAPVHDGLGILGGLGSRGLVWAPLLAEALASELNGEPAALERGAAEALHPARFLVRQLKRNV